MFLLPSILLGLVFAVVLGGRPSRLLAVRFRLGWAVVFALVLQSVVFTRIGADLPAPGRGAVHIGSYALLVLFAGANLRTAALAPVLLGMMLNAAAIAANGGSMPVSHAALRASGVTPGNESNLSESAHRLWFLGDVFALPSSLPFANVFSVGDILIALGLAAFVVFVSVGQGDGQTLSPSRLLEPLRQAPYRRLAAGKLVSFTGDWLTLGAVVGWIYQETRSTTQVAALLLVRLGPPILGGGAASLVVDRLPKRALLVWVELGRAVAVGCALLAVLRGDRALVFAALGCSGALGALSAAAVPSLVPSLLSAEQLPAANAGLQIANDVAMAVGALGAGAVLSATGAPAALALDLATFGLAALLYLRLPAGRMPLGSREGGDSPWSGLRYLLSRRSLLLLVFSFSAATLATGLTQASLPRFLQGHLGIGPGAYGFGMAALAIGLALGEALVGFTRVGPTAGRWIGAGLLFMAGLFALLGLVDHAPTALLLLAAIGFVDGTTDVLFDTAVQRDADPRHYGAVFGFSSAMTRTTMMGAVAVAPLANRFLDPQRVILGASAFLVLAGVIALAGMRARADKTAPLPERKRAAAPPIPLDLEPRVEPRPRPELVFSLAEAIPAVAAFAGPAPLRPSLGLAETSTLAARRDPAPPPPAPREEPGAGLVSRAGDDLTVIAWGGAARTAEQAAAELQAESASIEVLDLPQVSPWDKEELLASVRKTSKVLILHEDSGPVGRAAEIAATIAEEAFEHLDAPVRRVPAGDTATVVAAVRDLLAY